MVATINCERCGKEVPVRGGKRKYCTHCSNLVYRETMKLNNEKQKLLTAKRREERGQKTES